jgi:hypothetical protein
MHHQGVEFEVTQIGPRRWVWTIYPRKQKSILGRAITREVTAFDRQEAIAQCKLEIARKLWRQTSSQES